MSLSDVAAQYLASGLSILPIRPDGSKAPDWPEWKTFQTRLATADEVSRFRPNAGIAIIAGSISGNLEIIDIDDAETFTPWAELVETHLGREFFERLVIVKTPRPGFHVYFRCSAISGNLKLAQISRQDGPRQQIKTLIETRGEGGYVLAPGSPVACHESGRSYEIVQGRLEKIPKLTESEREVLLSCGRSFNQVWRPAEESHVPALGSDSVGGDFCSKASWAEILKPHGFKSAGMRGDSEYWTRPGKDHGVSASTNHNGSNLFYPFSTNCSPFDSSRGYNKFGVYALLNHVGDFRTAAKALADMGYGKPRPAAKPAIRESIPMVPSVEIISPSSLHDRVRHLWQHGLERGIHPGWANVGQYWNVRKGEWTLLTGIPSHGKSSFADALMVNLARRENWKWCVFSAENLPQELHVINLLEQFIGKPFHIGTTSRMGESDIQRGMDFIQDHFRFLSPPEEEETLPRLLDLVESGSLPDGILIDPWNELTHNYAGSTETEYISKQLKLLGRFVKRHAVHAIVVAHPAKMKKEQIDGGMRYPVPTPYDISGSAHFRNKADNCLCMWRDETNPGTSTLFIQKIRRRFVGKVGSAELSYDVVTGRFSDPYQRREPGEEG